MYLAERIVLKKGFHKEEYELADRAAPLAKLLYNAALFHVRQIFTGWDKEVRTENEKEVFDKLALLKRAYPELNVRRVISYNTLEKLMRVTDNPDLSFDRRFPAASASHPHLCFSASLINRRETPRFLRNLSSVF